MTEALLDPNKKQEVTYCIPGFLRDEQIRVNTASVKGRIEPGGVRDEPIAIVCYGPSLNQTWKYVRDFKHRMTCSGAHRFLIERGIIPTHHVEVDPREHKIKLIGQPHSDVEYLIASACHPKLFKHLEGFNTKLWHIFNVDEDGQRILPPGEWALTGGIGAGLRAFVLARFLGFKEFHVFGMDGSEGETGKHAGEHPSQAQTYCLTEYEGVKYRTTPAFLEAARTTWHELDQLPDVTAKFYGDGLVQAMSRNYKRGEGDQMGCIAFANPELISPELKALNAKLHEENLCFGVGGGRYAPIVVKILDREPRIKSVLDYGCGKGYLAKTLTFPIWEYDPAVTGKDQAPRPADLVMCTDVLEHVEPDKLKLVLGDLARCVKQVGYFVIFCGAAQKSYADGRNTHLIQEKPEWWVKAVEEFFTVGQVKTSETHVAMFVGPKAA